MRRCVMCNGTGTVKSIDYSNEDNPETTDCMYCSGTGIMTHESDDEQLINLLKNNKKHSILLMKTDECGPASDGGDSGGDSDGDSDGGVLVHFNGSIASFVSLFLSGLDSLIKQTGDRNILWFILNELMSREDENE